MIRDLRPDDIPQALEISRTELGSDYLDEGDFLDAIDGDGWFCKVAEIDGRIAGFAICRVFGPESEPEALGLPDCPERDLVLSHGRIGLLDSVAVSPSFKGRGVGTGMCGACLERFSEMGCTLVTAMAWKSVTGTTNIGGILSRMGMRETVSIQGYWNGMVDSPEGHHCPVCGAPCRCWGVLWMSELR